MAHPNEELLRKQDAAMSSGDMEGIFAPFAEDVVAHIGGRSKIAGDYKGKDQLQEVYGRFMQAMGENVRFETHDIIANDTHGVVMQRFHGERGGKSVDIGGVGIFHFSGGKITEVWLIDIDPYEADPWYDAGL